MRLEGSGDWLEAAGFAGWLEKPIRVGTFAGAGAPVLRRSNRVTDRPRDAVLAR